MFIILVGLSIQLLIWGTIVVGCFRFIKSHQYTREDYEKGLKLLGIVLGIILLVCINGNSNQNPNSFMDRIFRPISGSDWMFNYAGLISLVGIYYLVHRIYKINETKWLNETWKRLLAVMLILNFLAPMQQDLIKVYRSWQKGVDSIYLYRDQMKLEVDVEDEGNEIVITLDGRVGIENMSSTYRECGMRITVPSYCQKLIGEEWIEVYPENEERYEIGAKQKEDLEFEHVIRKDKKALEKQFGKDSKELNVGGGSTSTFEVFLYDDETEAYFEVNYFNKRFIVDEEY